MAEPTLGQVFGSNAAQTSSPITISKADLATTGLTASSTNTAESLLAAIVLLAKTSLTPENFNTVPEQSVTIAPGFNSIVAKTDGAGVATEYRQFQYSIGFHKLDNATLDPDDL